MLKQLKLLTLILFSLSVYAEDTPIQSLDDLMKLIQIEQAEQRTEFKERKAHFIKEKNEQQKLLNKANSELAQLEKIQKELIQDFTKHEKELAELQEELQIVVGSLGELFGVVKQVAGDLHGDISTSIVSAEIKNRIPFLRQIVDRKKLPNIQELRRLWLELQLEMTELGQIRKFDNLVVLKNGKQVSQTIIRVGGFNLVSQGKYLSYQSETSQIMELPKQPPRKFRSYIKDLESAETEYSAFALDPSRGSLLSVLLRVPTLRDRLAQGGIVGYVIILLFFIGLGIGIYRFFIIKKEGEKIKLQLDNNQHDKTNPLGKLRMAFERSQDMETLEIKLDEIIVQSLPTFEKGIDLIRILAAVAPLLGLLGTVLGMIETFQSITLFGTGDPKLMASGISEALITTTLGLLCAIPLLFLHTLISGKSKAIVQILEEQAAGLIVQKTEENKNNPKQSLEE